MMRPKRSAATAGKPPAAPTGPDAWVRAGLALLASDGIQAVRIEPLAARLGVTKGSFYWHFEDRAALHAAMLEAWATTATRDIVRRVDAHVAPPAGKLRHLIDLTALNGRLARLETALRSWARHDAAVAAAVGTIDAERIAYVSALLVAMGIPPDRARVRARIVYLVLIGGFFAETIAPSQAAEALWREVEALVGG